MRYRLISPPHLNLPTLEGSYSPEQLSQFNEQGYNIYYFPNHSSKPISSDFMKGKHVDIFDWIFIDMDLKDGIYKSKKEFAEVLKSFSIKPTKTVDSGRGVHCYWKITDLDRESYIKLQKRLIKHFKTDDSVWTISQLMRCEGYYNTKDPENLKLCKVSKDKDLTTSNSYSVLDFGILPQLDETDLRKISEHLDKVDGIIPEKYINVETSDLPERFLKMLESSEELHDFFYKPFDRSVCDMKIANILQIAGFEEEEAVGILLHTDKGSERGIEYVASTIKKVWDNPLDELVDDDYADLEKIANCHEYIEELRKENFAYKVMSENKKIRLAKETDKMRGKFSLKNSRKHRMGKFIQDTEDDINSMGTELPFVGPKLTKSVCLSNRDYMLIGANSGRGKSTMVSNVAVPILEQGKKVLIISTEESASEIIKRTMCLILGYDYGDEKSFPDYKRMKIAEEYKKHIDNLVVVDYLYKTPEGVPSQVSTMEGFENVLEGVREEEFELIIVDYLTKINTSITYPQMKFNTVIDQVGKFLEEYQKSTKIPIVAFTQLHNKKDGEQVEYKNRIRGSKSLYEYVTICCELITDTEAGVTTVKFEKVRKVPNGFRWTVDLMYSKGKYIEM